VIKNTKDLFNKLKIDKNILSLQQKQKLDEDGFIIFENCEYMKKNLTLLNKESKRLIALEKDLGGWEGKKKYFKQGKKFEEGADRLGALVNKHKVFLEMIKIPEILVSAYHVVKSDLKIAAVNLRNPHQGSGEQRIHIDGNPRLSSKDNFAGVVCFCFLDDSKLENGAIRMIPKSHKLIGYPDEYININSKNKFEKRIVVKAGTIIVANLNIWHGGAKNISGESRKMIMVNVKNRNQDQLLNYKKFLSNDIIKNLSPEESYLLATRDSDPTQVSDSGGSAGDLYRKFLKINDNIKLKDFSL
jgi:hypothetical protein